MGKKFSSKYIVESVDISAYMELHEDLGWLSNVRGIDVLLRTCKNYCSLGFKYIDTDTDEENPWLFHMKFEKGKV